MVSSPKIALNFFKDHETKEFMRGFIFSLLYFGEYAMQQIPIMWIKDYWKVIKGSYND